MLFTSFSGSLVSRIPGAVQCQNLECSYTFTALESVDTIIMKPRRNEQESEKAQMPEKQQQTLNRYGSASKLSSRQQIPV
ncbi:ogr/Delta-like zinc finger family protein [Escherichia coli]|nr:ogr/Delta-like zinc finger family protein [Escherichia coli]